MSNNKSLFGNNSANLFDDDSSSVDLFDSNNSTSLSGDLNEDDYIYEYEDKPTRIDIGWVSETIANHPKHGNDMPPVDDFTIILEELNESGGEYAVAVYFFELFIRSRGKDNE